MKKLLSSAIVLKRQSSPGKEEVEEKKAPPKPDRPENIKKRDKVMFGSLMNHLKKAKTTLENDQSLV